MGKVAIGLLVERKGFLAMYGTFFVLAVGLLRGRGVRGWSASIIASTCTLRVSVRVP